MRYDYNEAFRLKMALTIPAIVSQCVLLRLVGARTDHRTPAWSRVSTGLSENRTRRLRLVTVLVSLLVCVSCAKQKPEAEYRPTTTIRDLMDGVVDPAADTIWNSVGTTISKEGTDEKAPHTDEEWGTVRNGAIELLEASNLLQIPGRHVAMPGQLNNQGIELQPPQIETLITQDRQAWITFAHGLHDAATQALNAVDAKDPARVLESGDAIDSACEHCHQKYWYPPPVQSHGK